MTLSESAQTIRAGERYLSSVNSRTPAGDLVSGRIPELDGLRGLAILIVLLYHFIHANARAECSGLLRGIGAIFGLGWSGVDLFFVLSGFLIGGILLDSKNSARYFRTFYLRRLHRIIPIYFLWLTVFAVVAFVVSQWLPANLGFSLEKPRVIFVYVLFLQNLVNLQHSDFSWFWLAALWSLAVEEQFYLLAPAVIRLLSLRRLVALLACAIAAAPALRILLYMRGHTSAMYTWMPSRADALATGVLLAILWRNPAGKSWLSSHQKGLYCALFLLLGGMAVLGRWFPLPKTLPEGAVGFTWMAAFYGTLMLVILLDTGGLLGRLARGRFLRELGCLSYCMYLIHVAVNGSCHVLLRGSFPSVCDWEGVATTLVAAGATWGLAKISWLYFEKPLVRRGHVYQY